MESFIKKLEELNLFLVKKEENLVLRGLKGKLNEEDKDKIKNNKEIISFIKTNKKELLQYLDKRSLIDSFYKLSPLQEGMLFHGLYDESSKTYVEQMSVDFPKGVVVEVLKASWNYVIENHSILRTSFLYEELSIPLQCVYKRVRLPFEELDYSTLKHSEKTKKLEQFLIQDCEKGFAFNEVPLLRITLIKTGDLSYTMVFTHHHILMDGWSCAILMEELLVAYEAFLKGETLPEIKEDLYEDYIKYIQKNDVELEDQFWKGYVKNLKAPSVLPFLETTDLRNKGIGNNKTLFLNIEAEFTTRLMQYAKKHRLTMNSIIQGVWALLLSRYTGAPDVVYGVTVSGRPTDLEKSEQRLGLYINTLPFYSHITHNDTVVNWLTALQLNTVSSREYQYTSLAKIQGFSGVKGDLFDSILVFENYPVSEVLKTGSNVLDVSNIKTKEQSNYLLTIAVNLGQQLSIEFNYNDQLLESSTIEMIKNHFNTVLEQLLISSDLTRVSDIDILTKEESDQLIYGFNPSENALAKGETIVSLFEEQVGKNPNNTSVVFQGTTMTYAELDKRSNQLAHYLIEEYAIQKEDFIGVKLDRSDELIISLIAILKTGGAYLPIDPNYPKNRIEYIESDSQCKVSITPKLFSDFKIKESKYKEKSPKVSIQSDTLAYIIYTSGSTGRPKGVMIEHGGIVNTVTAQINHFSIRNSEHCLQFSNQSFDASIWEILITLLSGSKLFIIEEAIKSDIALMTNFINDNKITWVTLPPAFVKLIDIANLHTVKTLITAGEEAPIAKAKAFSKKGKYINAYGPTETSICATVFDGKIEDKVSIGKPIANTKVYILSDDLQLQPLLVVGELCVSGVG
ncbi:condensation domain-containing protein, partial [Flavivirga jejuensis]